MKKFIQALKKVFEIEETKPKVEEQKEENPIVNVQILKGETFDIKMPRYFEDNFEGKVVQYFFNVGDIIKSGDIIAEIETEKFTIEFDALYGGKIIWLCDLEKDMKIDDLMMRIEGV
ncbi:lipoyl domain-containing protein [Aureivirga sp. CE67]|uniref:lipoyl domain-containing protein n=1 Tax=Aureivirga sp. CE67 TaxID=1788983 RepID=UPI0018CB52BB|nr:biotin/lipoyl-containing protein [Aureivirga sp. CE67]